MAGPRGSPVLLPGVALLPGRGGGRVVDSGRASPGLVLRTPEAREGYEAAGEGFAGIITSELAVADLEPGVGVLCPMVGGIDLEAVLVGDLVQVDGTEGTVAIPDVAAVHVVTAILQRADGRILLLRRSERVGSFRGQWAGVSGFLEGRSPRAQVETEILEETGIEPTELRSIATAPPVFARDRDRLFVIHPFLFEVRDPAVRIDWEHTEHEWVEPAEIGHRPTVPRLDRVWEVLREGASRGSSSGKR